MITKSYHKTKGEFEIQYSIIPKSKPNQEEATNLIFGQESTRRSTTTSSPTATTTTQRVDDNNAIYVTQHQFSGRSPSTIEGIDCAPSTVVVKPDCIPMPLEKMSESIAQLLKLSQQFNTTVRYYKHANL